MFELFSVIFLLIFLEGILSIDNAAVLGAMVAHLPKDKPIPWPNALRGLAPLAQRYFGNQQMAALKVGLLGAYVGRALMLLVAVQIVQNPALLLIGAGYLFWLAINHFAGLYKRREGHADGHLPVRQTGFWMTVLLIEIADLAFSLDNVVVAATLSENFWIIALGVGIGIVIMRFAAGIFTRLIEWEPNLEHAAFALLLAISFETFLKVVYHIETEHWMKFLISMFILAMTVAIPRVPALRWLNGVLRALLPIAAGLQGVIKIIWAPFGWLLKLLWSPFRSRSTPSH